MENKDSAQIVTIKELIPIYKNGEPANAIELAHVEEHNFDIIVQKGLYLVGDKAVYIQPDYCLPLKTASPTKPELLLSVFTEPNGNPGLSKLGKGNRIRAIKFNFSTNPDVNTPIYSMGIILPINEIVATLGTFDFSGNIGEQLQVTKYEEPEAAYSGLAKGMMPSGMYKTDETNFLNFTRINYPIKLTGSVKVDGSSISIYYRSDEEEGICSRSLEKKLDQKYISGYKLPNGNTLRKHFVVEDRINCWIDEVAGDIYLAPDETWIPIKKEVDDTFVKLGRPVLEKLKQYCKSYGKKLVLRGEMCGEGLKGSGNKNNPHAKLKQSIKFYGLDDYGTGVAIRLPEEEFIKVTSELKLDICNILFFDMEFKSFDEIKDYCNMFFSTNLIEGIVLRNTAIGFSAKFMNPDYDSKK